MDKYDYKNIKYPLYFGGYEFYLKKGKVKFRKVYARHSREALLYSPQLEPVRKSNEEMVRMSQFNKVFRKTLLKVMVVKSPHFHSHVMRLLGALQALDLWSALGERSLHEALKHPSFGAVLNDFDYTPHSMLWRGAVEEAFAVDSGGGFCFLPERIAYEALACYLSLRVGIGEVVFDFKTLTYRQKVQMFDLSFYDTEGRYFRKELTVEQATEVHFWVYGVFVVPEYDYKLKRSTQVKHLQWLGVKVLPKGRV